MLAGYIVSTVQNSRWLKNVGKLLKGASRVCEHLEAGDPVLVHCSDGWDRTPQLTALAQLMLDPYYRTIEGFEVVIQLLLTFIYFYFSALRVPEIDR